MINPDPTKRAVRARERLSVGPLTRSVWGEGLGEVAIPRLIEFTVRPATVPEGDSRSGVGLGTGLGIGEGDGLGVGVGAGVLVGAGVGEGVGVGVGVGEGGLSNTIFRETWGDSPPALPLAVYLRTLSEYRPGPGYLEMLGSPRRALMVAT